MKNIDFIQNESKSVYDMKEKNDLLCCKMHMYETRKVTYKKLQVDATLRD